jgi:DNA excision repair protein ERCC-4
MSPLKRFCAFVAQVARSQANQSPTTRKLKHVSLFYVCVSGGVRLIRFANTTCFIKALSDNAEGFTMQQQHNIEAILKSLWLRRLYLWPRFEQSIISSLNAHAPQFEEVRVAMTPLMTTIQHCLTDIVLACLRELRRLCPSLSSDVTDFERGLASSFDGIVRRQLDHIWYKLPKKTKQLVRKTLRHLILNETAIDSYDFVDISLFSFYILGIRLENCPDTHDDALAS